MTKISAADVKKLAQLSRLRLTEKEISQYQKELSAILSYVEKLQAVDITGLAPTSQVTGLHNVYRPDELLDYQTSPNDLLKNAPAVENHQFKVKRVL